MQPPPSRVERWGLAGILVLALLLRVAALPDRTLSWDEAVNIKDVEGGLERMIGILILIENKPPLAFALEWCARHAGSSTLAIRAGAALLGTAAAGVAWAIGRRLLGPAGGALAGLGYALSSAAVWEAGSTRYYALTSLLSGIQLLLFLRWLSTWTRPGRGDAPGLAFTLLTASLPYTSYFAGLLPAGELLAAGAILGLRHGALRVLCARFLLAALLFLPWAPALWLSLREGAHPGFVGGAAPGWHVPIRWIDPVNLLRSLLTAWPRPVCADPWVPWAIGAMGLAIGPLLVAGAVRLWRTPAGRALLLSAAAPAAVTFGVSILWRPIYSPPYLYFLAVPAAAVLAAGALASGSRLRAVSVCAAVCALSLSTACFAAMRDAREPDTGGVARAAEEVGKGGLIVYHTSPHLLLPVSVQASGQRHLLLAGEEPPLHLGAGFITERDLARSIPAAPGAAVLVVAVPHRSWERPVDVPARVAELAPGFRVTSRADLRGAAVLRLERD